MMQKNQNIDIYGYKKNNKLEEEESQPILIPNGINMPRAITTLYNNIYFYDDINVNSCLEFNLQLKKLYTELLHTNILYGLNSHINLYINTYGGDFFSTMSIVDAMRVSPIPIHTIIDGIAASGGSIISIHGNKRFITKNSYILIHQLRGATQGTFEDIKDDMENSNKHMIQMKNMYKKKSKMTAKQIAEILKHDFYLNAEEALDFGLVDEII